MPKGPFPGQLRYSSLIPMDYQLGDDKLARNRLLNLLWKLDIACNWWVT